jgi:branched-chain amino acid aminotransferase
MSYDIGSSALTAIADGIIQWAIERTARPVPAAERDQLLVMPGFGRVFTDHMVTAHWSQARQWHDWRLRPYAPLSLDPAAVSLHYGQVIFEGLKAYWQEDGSIAAFRPRDHAARLNRSAARLAIPQLPEGFFLQVIEILVAHDRRWIPNAVGKSLYLRPFIIAVNPTLGVNEPAVNFTFGLIASPASTFFGGDFQPVTAWVCRDYARAAPGGTGAVKTAGNYASAMAGQVQAREHGCDQAVWLDATERRWVEEMGAMNIFFVYGAGPDARLLTPALTGTLLPGITRDTLLKLAPGLGIPVDEGRLTIDEWQHACEAAQITEVFACGTAAMIVPVGRIRDRHHEWVVDDGAPGPVTTLLRNHLAGIHHGSLPDPHGWVHRIP